MLDYKSFFENTFLLNRLKNDNVLDYLVLNVKEKVFEKGELVYSCGSNNNELAFIYDGECEVKSADNDVTINVLKKYSSFGITSVFSDDYLLPTNIYARKHSKILFLSRKALCYILDNNPDISRNIILFLINRVEFLNKKLYTFSRDSVEKKLAAYILSQLGDKDDEIKMNLNHTAELIGVGRASLYRALGDLVEKNIITRSGKIIKIINKNQLERI